MKVDRGLALAMLAPSAALGLWLALGGGLLWATLNAASRATVSEALGPLVESHGVLLISWWLAAAALAAWLVGRLHEAYVAAVLRLAATTQVLVADAAAPDLPAASSGPTRALTGAINGLARARRALDMEMARLVDEASRSVAEQRDQLAALMAELNQSVVVCNLDGRILLYNEQARQLFRRVSRGPGRGAGAEPIGLGRPIDGAIDRALIDHALTAVERQIARGDGAASARFVISTPAGHLIRVNMAPVRRAAAEAPALAGFVLLLADVTDEHASEARRDRETLSLIETSRASLANMQAALDMLDYPDLDAAGRERFHAVVRDEVGVMSTRITAFAEIASAGVMTRWELREMLGADLLGATQRRIAADLGLSATLEDVDPGLWLMVDSFALIEALAFLARRLAGAGVTDLRLRLAAAGSRAHLDLAWSEREIDQEALHTWRYDAMDAPVSVRDVAERHGGEVWVARDRSDGLYCFRFLMPVAAPETVATPALSGSRPEYYDFDLFAGGASGHELDDRPLTAIAYTVFDTETTGLEPLRGDEILQIGATRIVNGKLLRGECFDQLVDPGRSISEASTRIHGIRPEDVRGQPTLAEVLPAFHAFAGDTVLVGHNVAFDMRFLKLKEGLSGVRFEQPILDTLLLSSIAHPTETSHGLEATAARLGLFASQRHTALSDALLTAEVFLKLLPLLRERGMLTLSQAIEVSRSSHYAKLRY